jgi:transcriptional regulator with XRE-family HTH domain
VTLFEKLELLPPCHCRLLARKSRGRQGLSHEEIAKLAGLSVATVAKLSFQTDWGNVTIDVARRFSEACGVNHLSASAQLDYLRRRKMAHVFRAPSNQQKFYNRLFVVVAEKMKRKRNEHL